MALLSSLFVAWHPGVACSTELRVGEREFLTVLLQVGSRHEAEPYGVPKTFDWKSFSRPGRMNDPAGFTALMGWAQVFSTRPDVVANIKVKNFRTFVCLLPERRWVLALETKPVGRAFRPDYAGNKSVSLKTSYEQNVYSVSARGGEAFHFWHDGQRFDLGKSDVCGVAVVLEAKADGAEGAFVLGVGADYWLDLTSDWDNYKTNKDVAIGRLRLLSDEWKLFGMSTASGVDTRQLYQKFFSDNPE